MMRIATLLIAVAACGQPPPPQAVVAHARPSVPDAAVPDAPGDGETIALPGCTPAEREARRDDLETLAHLRTAQATDGKTLVAALRTFLDRPCFRHVKPAFTFPAELTLQHWADTFDSTALYLVIDGLLVREGAAYQVIPGELMPDLDAKGKAALANLHCTATDGSCAPAEAYMLRAEAAFDARFEKTVARHYPRTDRNWSSGAPELHASVCDDATWTTHDSSDPRPTTYEAWVACVTSRVPTTLRFHARGLRPPASGWLVLRGTRGHYQVANEIRAYDLATGAAYVASDANNWQPAAGVTPGITAYTGRVDPGHVRELAFMLLARDTLVRLRPVMYYAEVPAKLSRELTKSGSYPALDKWPRYRVFSSGETEISFLLLDGKQRTTGTFTWDGVFEWVDLYLQQLTTVMEAGLIKGCTAAKLPDATQLAIPATAPAALVTAFDGLRTSTCKGVK